MSDPFVTATATAAALGVEAFDEVGEILHGPPDPAQRSRVLRVRADDAA